MSISSIPSYRPYSPPSSLPALAIIPSSSRSSQCSTPSVCSSPRSYSVFSPEQCTSSLASPIPPNTSLSSLSTSCLKNEQRHIHAVSLQRSLGISQQRGVNQVYNGSQRVRLDDDHVKILPKCQRQNPRRSDRLLVNQRDELSGQSASKRLALLPPPLLRQSERKHNFVDSLVDTAAQIVEAIWPSPTSPCLSSKTSERIIPLRLFIQETLRRSRTSYSTLQVALYYLILLRPRIDECNRTQTGWKSIHTFKSLHCGRRMFLAALILASKYLQDRNYSARAWSKISGLNIAEINVNELAFLTAVDWKLHISDAVFEKWTNLVLKFTPTSLPPGLSHESSQAKDKNQFNRLISSLTPDIEVVGDLELAKLYGIVEKSDHCSLWEQQRTPSKSPFFSVSSIRADCELNNSSVMTPESSVNVISESCSVDHQTPFTTEFDSSSIIIHRGRQPLQKRIYGTSQHIPRSNDASDSDSDLSSSPESTCSIFSKTSRSSSISSASSKTSPVVTNLCSDSNVAIVSSGNAYKRPLYQPCTRLPVADPLPMEKCNRSISDTSFNCSLTSMEQPSPLLPHNPARSKFDARRRNCTVLCNAKQTDSREISNISPHGFVEDKRPRIKRIKCYSTKRELDSQIHNSLPGHPSSIICPDFQGVHNHNVILG